MLSQEIDSFQCPGLLTTYHRHPTLRKHSPDIVLHAVDPTQNHFAVLHQPAVLALFSAGYVDRDQLSECSKLGQLERIIPIRLTFDVLPLRSGEFLRCIQDFSRFPWH